MQKLLITGDTGFVGRNLVEKLQCTNKSDGKPKQIVTLNGTRLNKSADFSHFLEGVEGVIHCAGQTPKKGVSESVFYETNTEGTLNLAKQSAEAGVKRFIFISTIKVNGENTEQGRPFFADDAHNPHDAYARSKSLAERGLQLLSQDTGMEVVIIRPTLVYGAGVESNFSSLVGLVARRVPLPFGKIKTNKRSLVSVDNLVDIILHCLHNDKAANQTFLVSDDRAVSTSEMVYLISQSLGQGTVMMLSIPVWAFGIFGKLLRKEAITDRLIGSLEVDIQKNKALLGWEPIQSVEEGFKAAVSAINITRTNR
ncbi:NAD-dependent epimerase/dehydratase family protein [Vibrio brasiliensis]|uniref:NAD-dependent epimerase/dehydratase family protein n=1 Tax=Vibrio brasiliensis TaxID=170652 RepID=UPI001EFE04FD|nr:NAD-dependent epimerase/dehydratase family protein [Vibrio brasiliensis]MCG9750333.1 NAD-dependent epimerase/dehydratase family protein [Vibrio brasiliensis]